MNRLFEESRRQSEKTKNGKKKNFRESFFNPAYVGVNTKTSDDSEFIIN
jgi:hypothetical protein